VWVQRQRLSIKFRMLPVEPAEGSEVSVSRLPALEALRGGIGVRDRQGGGVQMRRMAEM
jgi:hypothetical protein